MDSIEIRTRNTFEPFEGCARRIEPMVVGFDDQVIKFQVFYNGRWHDWYLEEYLIDTSVMIAKEWLPGGFYGEN